MKQTVKNGGGEEILDKAQLYYQIHGANIIVGVKAPTELKSKLQNLFYNFGCSPWEVNFVDISEDFFKFQTNPNSLFVGLMAYFHTKLVMADTSKSDEEIEKVAKQKTIDTINIFERDQGLLDKSRSFDYYTPTEKSHKLSAYIKPRFMKKN